MFNVYLLEKELLVGLVILTLHQLLDFRSILRFGSLIRLLVQIKLLYGSKGVSGETHTEAAMIMLQMAQWYGGMWGKIGQFMSMRDDVLPKEWSVVMTSCMDRLPPKPFATVKKSIERELGKNLLDVFEWVDETPISCATIAQVHKAGLLINGRVHDVALKIQHDDVERAIASDIAWFGFVVRILRFFVPVSSIYALDLFMSGILSEFDFEREAMNMESAAATLNGQRKLRENYAVPFSRKTILEDIDILENGTEILIQFDPNKNDSEFLPGHFIEATSNKDEFKVMFYGSSFEMVRSLSQIMLRGDDLYIDVCIPRSIKELCSKRLLVMTFAHGVALTHPEAAFKAVGSEEELFDQIAMIHRAFLFQVFCQHKSHGDPHAGNILVNGPNKPPVLLDFGLYFHLDSRIVNAFCKTVYGATQYMPKLCAEGLRELGFKKVSNSELSEQEQMKYLCSVLFAENVSVENVQVTSRVNMVDKRRAVVALESHGILARQLVYILRICASVATYTSRHHTKPVYGIFPAYARFALEMNCPGLLAQYE